MDDKTLQDRINMVIALQIAIAEANKLNIAVGDMHAMLEALDNKKKKRT